MTATHTPPAAFEHELAELINRHGKTLNSDQIISTLERALDKALVIAGEPEATKAQRELMAAAKAMLAGGGRTVGDARYAALETAVAKTEPPP